MTRREVTIADVARRAGVSITTVSYVFNNRAGISEETRRRVRTAAAELHYSPNAHIRSLRSRRSHVIGLYLWPLGTNPAWFITASLLQGITDALNETEYDLLLYSHRSGRFAAADVTAFLDKRVDGLIWTPAPVAYGALDALASAGLPTVAVLHAPAPRGVGQVEVENASGSRAAVEHLLTLGHRRIAFVGSYRLSDFVARLAGYREALSAAGFPTDPALELMGDQTWLPAEEIIGRIRETQATAVFCASDAQAGVVIRAARRAGLRVPEDLSVVGFDDVPAAAGHEPPLTTVRLPAADVGRAAARHLMEILAGKSGDEARSVLPVSLQARETTAPPGENQTERTPR